MPELDVVGRAPHKRGRKVLHSKSGKPLAEIERKKKRERFRGVPPPPTFDIDTLAPGTFLTETEVAALLRRSTACLENWRLMDTEHPLRWQKIAGRILYQVRAVRAFLEGKESAHAGLSDRTETLRLVDHRRSRKRSSASAAE
jgi:hypothetical protein